MNLKFWKRERSGMDRKTRKRMVRAGVPVDKIGATVQQPGELSVDTIKVGDEVFFGPFTAYEIVSVQAPDVVVGEKEDERGLYYFLPSYECALKITSMRGMAADLSGQLQERAVQYGNQ